MRKRPRAASLLARHPLFARFNAAWIEDLIGRATEIHVDAGSILYASGTPATAVYVLLSGAIQIEYPAVGEERGPAVAILMAPSFLGESQVLASAPWSGTGVAIAEAIALALRRREFLALLGADASFTRALYVELSQRFLGAIESWRRQPALKPDANLARYLVGLQEALGERRLEIRQVDLGRATGLRRETVNRVLRRWSQGGLVAVDPHGVEMLDPTQLRAIAGASLISRLVLELDITLALRRVSRRTPRSPPGPRNRDSVRSRIFSTGPR